MSELAKAHAEIERLNRIINSGDTLRDHAIRKAMRERDEALARLSDIESQNRMMWDVANDREARLAEAVKDNERLHAVAGRLIAVIRNVHGHLLDDRIDAALLGATDSATNRENERE